MKLTQIDEKHVVNFRGRKLQGKTVRVPEGYTGVVVQLPDKEEEVETVKKAFRVDDNSESDDQVAETEARKMAGFDEIMIWEHGQMPDASSDPYMKGMQEWIAFAQTVCEAVSFCWVDEAN